MIWPVSPTTSLHRIETEVPGGTVAGQAVAGQNCEEDGLPEDVSVMKPVAQDKKA
jgi:hypothetical protein